MLCSTDLEHWIAHLFAQQNKALRRDSRIGDAERFNAKRGAQDVMNRIISSISVLAVATALLSTSSLADPPRAGASKEDPSVRKKVAFHVIGLMKTKSGAM